MFPKFVTHPRVGDFMLIYFVTRFVTVEIGPCYIYHKNMFMGCKHIFIKQFCIHLYLVRKYTFSLYFFDLSGSVADKCFLAINILV